MKGAFVFLMCLPAYHIHAQTLEDVAVLKKQEQTCLVLYDKDAEFIKQRVITLIKRRNK
jgi:hypothetical protein